MPVAKTITRAEQRQRAADKLGKLLNGFTFLFGPMGRGKTVSAVGISRQIRELFGIPIVAIGTDLGFSEDFGAYSFIDREGFVQECVKLNEMAKQLTASGLTGQASEDFIDAFVIEHRVLLYNAVLIIDELQNFASARDGNGRVARVFQEFIGVMRHYRCTLLGMAPRFHDVDVKFRIQAKWMAKPDIDTSTGWCDLRFQGAGGHFGLRLYVPDYAPMYNSWQPVGFDTKRLAKVLEKDV